MEEEEKLLLLLLQLEKGASQHQKAPISLRSSPTDTTPSPGDWVLQFQTNKDQNIRSCSAFLLHRINTEKENVYCITLKQNHYNRLVEFGKYFKISAIICS